MKLLLWFLADIVLGYIPQAAGCAIALFALTNQKIRSKSFLYTSALYALVAIAIRLAYNFELIDFGFHTVIIWMLFIVIAVAFNRAPVLQSTVSILLSGILITVAEVLTALTLTLVYGEATFTAIMNNTATLDGKIVKAFCGVPANILFLVTIFVAYIVLNKRRVKQAAVAQETETEQES